MRAGTLNRIICIRQPTTAGRSTDGEPLYTWTTILSSVWADRQPLTARELFIASDRWAEVERRYILRYVSTVTITPQCRLYDVADNLEYDIKTVINFKDDDREWHLLVNRTT